MQRFVFVIKINKKNYPNIRLPVRRNCGRWQAASAMMLTLKRSWPQEILKPPKMKESLLYGSISTKLSMIVMNLLVMLNVGLAEFS